MSELKDVFVQLSATRANGEPTLTWIFDHFDRNKTKIIILPNTRTESVSGFRDTAKSVYLRKCAEKKFKAEILVPKAQGDYEDTIVELNSKYGMHKFVTSCQDWKLSETSKFYLDTNHTCKIWHVKTNGKLYCTASYNYLRDSEKIAEALVENEKLKKTIKEEISRREEETSRRKGETRKLEEEIGRREEETRVRKEETRKREEETRKREEETRLRKEETRKREEETRKLEEETRKREEETRKLEEETRLRKEETRKREEEAKLRKEETRKLEEETRLRKEETRKLEEETRVRKEETRKLEEETRVRMEETRKREEETSRREEETRRREEETRRREEETRRREEETRRREEETARRENVERELLSMTKQANINEQEISSLNQQIDQLKQNKKLSTTLITIQELELATQNFSESLKIGEGEFGFVYRGTFRGTSVAVRKLKYQSKPGLSMLEQEVVIRNTIKHPHLVALVGSCSDPHVLVYEYLSKGSLLDYLNNEGNTTPLSWQVRTRIIGQVCTALAFLHSNQPNPIIHGDLRPENILLDADFTCKINDYGRVKVGDSNTTNSNPAKTLAYMDPEYLSTEEMTLESDVYSFGVLILHLLTGRSRLNTRKIVKETIGNDKFCTIIDESAGKWPLDHAKEVAKIGVWCADGQRSQRPHMINEVWPIVERLAKFPDEAVHV